MKKLVIAAVAALVTASLVAAASAAPRASSAPSGQDETWLKTSAQGDVFEIAGGKLALQKGRSQAVKSLARRLIEDHSKSLADARKTARELHVTLESSATPSEQWELQILHTYSGAEFDHWYSTLEVKDHQQDIQETTDEVRLGSSSEVVKDARQDLPMLKMHLRLSQAAARSS